MHCYSSQAWNSKSKLLWRWRQFHGFIFPYPHSHFGRRAKGTKSIFRASKSREEGKETDRGRQFHKKFHKICTLEPIFKQFNCFNRSVKIITFLWHRHFAQIFQNRPVGFRSFFSSSPVISRSLSSDQTVGTERLLWSHMTQDDHQLIPILASKDAHFYMRTH